MSDLSEKLAAIEARAEKVRVWREHFHAPQNNLDYSQRDVPFLLALVRDQAAKLAKVTELVRDLTDPEDCSFDHHGGCQAHGYLSLKPGETCPQLDAKAWVP